MKTEKTRILIVDDNKSFREAMKLFLKNECKCEIVGEATNGIEFINLIKTVVVDIVLMDIQMPELDGLVATKNWCLLHPQTKVIAVTMFKDEVHIEKLIEAGFKGCVFKTKIFTEINNVIKEVGIGGVSFDEKSFKI